MASEFEFAAPARVIFGQGRLREAGSLVKEWGNRCLVFTGGDPGRASKLLESLQGSGLLVKTVCVRGEPTFDGVREHVSGATSFAPDVILAIGGGSVIDTAKAVAMLVANGGDPMEYAEVIGPGRTIARPSIPFVAIPTTAGAGAEATRNAVLVERSKKAKVSLRSYLMLPKLVLIDPETTVSLSEDATAATGMDALSQLIEPFVSIKSNPATDALCRAGISRIARSLRRACEQPDDMAARTDMALASWWSGMALANAGLGAVHGFAAALGGMREAPHGLICARFLAPVCAANIRALRSTQVDHPVLGRYAEVAAIMTGQPGARPEDGVEWLADLAKKIPLRSFKQYGIDSLNEGDVIDAALRSSSMKGNPVALPREAMAEILEEAVGKSS